MPLKKSQSFLPLVLGLLCSSCGAASPSAEYDTLGPFLDSLSVEVGVPGLGFALFDDGGVLYEHVAGTKSQTTLEPIGAATAFEAASISKPVFAYVVFSLARDSVLDLDASLQAMVPHIPEIAYDPRSERLTPRMLLAHLGGLPNWRSRMDLGARSYSELFASDDTLRFVAEPGSGYRYSGEGYVLLQRIVEERTGKGLDELARERVFDPLGMVRSGFLFDTEIRRDYSLGHDAEGSPDKWELHLPLASSTLHTTASDLARFGSHLASQIRSDGPYAALANPEVTLQTDGVERSWGLGLGIVADAAGRYVYHGGNNVIFIADLMYGVEENLGYALLTNSANGQEMVDAVERRVFGRPIRD